jgi:hypothetical protein
MTPAMLASAMPPLSASIWVGMNLGTLLMLRRLDAVWGAVGPLHYLVARQSIAGLLVRRALWAGIRARSAPPSPAMTASILIEMTLDALLIVWRHAGQLAGVGSRRPAMVIPRGVPALLDLRSLRA